MPCSESVRNPLPINCLRQKLESRLQSNQRPFTKRDTCLLIHNRCIDRNNRQTLPKQLPPQVVLSQLCVESVMVERFGDHRNVSVWSCLNHLLWLTIRRHENQGKDASHAFALCCSCDCFRFHGICCVGSQTTRSNKFRQSCASCTASRTDCDPSGYILRT